MANRELEWLSNVGVWAARPNTGSVDLAPGARVAFAVSFALKVADLVSTFT
jgi:hypothetical protein